MNAEQETLEFLSRIGLEISKIDEGKEKSPDFLVKCENHTYLIELKEKFTDPNYLKSREKTLLRGDIFEEILPAGRKKRISDVIRSSCKQLSAKGIEADFRIVWLYAKGHHPDFQMYDFESTLYGYEVIVDWGKKDGFSGFCYHYGHSDFFNHKSILDGAIISTSDELKFCLNICSAKYEQLKNSELRKLLNEGVLDPIELEKKGDALIVDSTVDRKNEAAVMKYIIQKYNLVKAMKMPMQQLSGTIALPNKY